MVGVKTPFWAANFGDTDKNHLDRRCRFFLKFYFTESVWWAYTVWTNFNKIYPAFEPTTAEMNQLVHRSIMEVINSVLFWKKQDKLSSNINIM